MGHDVQVYEQLQRYESAHRALAAQRIPRAPSGNPFAADAPWKREDLHRVGQDDCERLGGIFYFRILWFNVGPPASECCSCWWTAGSAVGMYVQGQAHAHRGSKVLQLHKGVARPS